jgi:hypothetical protein
MENIIRAMNTFLSRTNPPLKFNNFKSVLPCCHHGDHLEEGLNDFCVILEEIKKYHSQPDSGIVLGGWL